MWIFRVDEPRPGVIRIREWRRRAHHTAGLLDLLLGGSATGLATLDQSTFPFANKALTALHDAGDTVLALVGDQEHANRSLENADAINVFIADDIIAKALIRNVPARMRIAP